MNHYGKYKPVCKTEYKVECEPKSTDCHTPVKHEPVCKAEQKVVCEPDCKVPRKRGGAGAAAGAGWLSLFGVGILIFILILIAMWIMNPRSLNKRDGDKYCDDRDIVKYIVIALILAIVAVILVAAAGAAATAGCAMVAASQRDECW